MTLAPRTPVLATPSAPPRVGLIASARELNRVEEQVGGQSRWGGGFGYEPENYCAGSGVVDPCDSSKPPDAGLGVIEYDPVLLWAADQCATFDRTRDRQGRARRRLLACQSKLLAGELWTGTVAIASSFPNKYLASPDANTVSDGALSEVNALACLEEALAACSCTTAMIHATPGLLTQWKAASVVERFGNVFRTANDTIVVADAGYTGSGPDGQPAADGSVWAYGTDVVEVRLDEVMVFPNADAEAMTLTPSADNTLVYRAERLAAASWDGCCHVAVEVDITVCADLANS